MQKYSIYNYGAPAGSSPSGERYQELAKFAVILDLNYNPQPQVIRKSRLYQGSHLPCYGDKEVTHYKLTAITEPKIESTKPTLNFHSYYYFEIDRYERNKRVGFDYRLYDGRGGVNSLDIYYESGRVYDDGRGFSSGNVIHRRWIPNEAHSAFTQQIETGNLYVRQPQIGVCYTITDTSPSDYQFRPVTGGNVEEITWSKVSLPYYWIDHMTGILNSNQTLSDYEALSECIRNTIQEYTTYDTNGYQNVLSFLQLINDARTMAVGDILKKSQDLWKDVLRATGHAVDDLSDSQALKKAGRRALRKKARSGAASAWLQYRYVYNTTKADYEQFVRAKVGEFLGSLDQNRVLRGSIGLSDGVLKVKMRLTDNTKPNFEKMLIGLNQYGLFPGLYNLWDMIPFSFIADWFSNLGDELQDIDQSIFFSYYEVNELLVSRKRKIVVEESWGKTTYEYYERRLYDAMPQWEVYEDPTTPSGRTVFKRCLDGISIVSGFI
jgi:hypothetical protein